MIRMKTSPEQRLIGCEVADFCPGLAQTEAYALAVMGGSSLVAPIGGVAGVPERQPCQVVQR